MRSGIFISILVAFSIILLGALVTANGNNNTSVIKKTVACGPVKLDITAGCSKYITYTINYYGTKPIKCYFHYKISPCEKMFKVKYQTSFTLKPGKNTFKVLVSPDFYLKPRAYHFYGYFYLGKYVLPIIKHIHHNSPSTTGNQSVIPNLPTTPVIPKPPNTPNIVPEVVPEPVIVGDPQSSTNWLFIGSLFVCIVVLSFTLLFLKKKEERVI